ncbi:MAG TPA: DUF3343 domain-containing protein [Ruminococcaceae bacterium]|nr:DUF3343 domain-containing protein [Oscillospiraceae bacterium]HCA72403.1 DUF3343 domain-containing protein [Oscillospiraceae bacterium]HCC01889.1 DUF3343 domain-containing protein [Oscillospiraceae bacterium]HCM23533.1 DUF3343 domain-containing protein [Oscillospiraceae bacterium]
MSKQLIIVSSITYAMKSRELLFYYGIKAYVERLPRTPDMPGCGYGVYVPDRTDEAERILRREGIHVLGRRERVSSK